MVFHEWSVGPLYLCPIDFEEDFGDPRRWPKPQVVGISQLHPPWREGKAVCFPVWPRVGWAWGIWRKRGQVAPDWYQTHQSEMLPRWERWQDVTPQEIGTWRSSTSDEERQSMVEENQRWHDEHRDPAEQVFAAQAETEG